VKPVFTVPGRPVSGSNSPRVCSKSTARRGPSAQPTWPDAKRLGNATRRRCSLQRPALEQLFPANVVIDSCSQATERSQSPDTASTARRTRFTRRSSMMAIQRSVDKLSAIIKKNAAQGGRSFTRRDSLSTAWSDALFDNHLQPLKFHRLFCILEHLLLLAKWNFG
jgi:hypothetical protein